MAYYQQPHDVTSLPAWQALRQHRHDMAGFSMREAFADDATRFQRFSLDSCGLLLDYSKNLINDDSLALLIQLAEQAGLPRSIEALYKGEQVNASEHRAALHTALRSPIGRRLVLDGVDIIPQVHRVLHQLTELVSRVHSGLWRGYSEKPIKEVVNIGIGGSFLSAAGFRSPAPLHPARRALPLPGQYRRKRIPRAHRTPESGNHAVHRFQQVLRYARNPEEHPGRTRLVPGHGRPGRGAASTLHRRDQQSQGSHRIRHPRREHLSHVGLGWRSLLAVVAIGLPIALAIGVSNFKELLAGAYAMDQHFTQAPLAENMPVLMALLGIWYTNFWDSQSHAILPYDHYLRNFTKHLQQLDMESNGKSVRQDGSALDIATGPVIWGGVGCNGQHAYHQLLHQGRLLVPADFIVPVNSYNPLSDHHQWLFANCLSQAQALMQGKSREEAEAELRARGLPEADVQSLAPHKVIPGNRPSNILVMNRIAPFNLGALVALYEHKVFVQSAIWGINAFDQWGVELGKEMGKEVYQRLTGASDAPAGDASTQGLIEHFRSQHRG